MLTKFRYPLCVICSSGGHLSEAIVALSRTNVKNKVIVTKFDKHVAGRLNSCEVLYIVDPHVSLHLFILNALQASFIFFKTRPKIVFSTGSGIALAFCVLSKLYGSKLIYLESGARVEDLSRTGKFLYQLSDVFYVQWESLLLKYPKAIYVGGLL